MKRAASGDGIADGKKCKAEVCPELPFEMVVHMWGFMHRFELITARRVCLLWRNCINERIENEITTVAERLGKDRDEMFASVQMEWRRVYPPGNTDAWLRKEAIYDLGYTHLVRPTFCDLSRFIGKLPEAAWTTILLSWRFKWTQDICGSLLVDACHRRDSKLVDLIFEHRPGKATWSSEAMHGCLAHGPEASALFAFGLKRNRPVATCTMARCAIQGRRGEKLIRLMLASCTRKAEEILAAHRERTRLAGALLEDATGPGLTSIGF